MRTCNPNDLRATWPSFLVAFPATALLFSAIDPGEVVLFGRPAGMSHLGMYTLAFLLLWLLCYAASVLNLWLFGCRRDAQWDD